MGVTLDHLRSYAVANSLFNPTTLKRALHRLGFVQADPIRAPARAQDLTLRHRVKDYRAGDLERRYAKSEIEEDFFVNYGFVTRALQALMHPRSNPAFPPKAVGPWPARRKNRRNSCWSSCANAAPCTRARSDDHFSHGAVKNYWGGSSNATTHLLDAMHYRGLLRVARREPAFASIPCISTGCGPATRPRAGRGSTRWSKWPLASTRRFPARAWRSWCAGCATRRRSGTAS